MTSASGAVVDLDRVGVRYGSASIVEDVSLRVDRGSVFALLGRNGAGKTSLLRCLLGQQRPSAGSARLFGADAWSRRRQAMARIGVVPEEPDAPPDMSPRALVDLCRSFYPRWDDVYVAALFDRWRVARDVPFGRLSKGQKGAVMLALALAHGPELLVLDDPTLGLDAVARRELFDEVIGALADRGTTVLITSHDLEGIERLADRVAIVKDRGLAVDEPLEQIKSRFRRLRVTGPAHDDDVDWQPFEVLTSSRQAWGAEAVVTNFSEDHLDAFQSRVRSGLEVLSLPLADIFVTLTAEREAMS